MRQCKAHSSIYSSHGIFRHLFIYMYILYIFYNVLFPNECKWGANTNAHNLLEIHLLVNEYTLSEWMQMRSKHKCTQLTRVTSTYDIIHSFRMNATKEHTQLHTTYSRYTISQALYIYIFFFFFFLLFRPHLLLKNKYLSIMAIVSLNCLRL